MEQGGSLFPNERLARAKTRIVQQQASRTLNFIKSI